MPQSGDGKGAVVAHAWDGPLDPSLDPDRYDPARDGHDLGRPADGAGDVDPVLSARAGGGRTLTDLLGDGAYEEHRETWVWVAGLVAVFGFLALAAVVLSHLSPA